MCDFFSFITKGDGKALYFGAEDRTNNELMADYDPDSHTSIATHFIGGAAADDKCNKYEYSRDIFEVDQINVKDDSVAAKKWINDFAQTNEFKDICLTAVQQDGCALKYVPEALRTEELCVAAVQQDGGALYYVPEALRTEELCVAAVQQDGGALNYVPDALRTEELCFTAVRQNGWMLRYVPEALRTEKMCMTAARQNGRALCYVPMALRDKIKNRLKGE